MSDDRGYDLDNPADCAALARLADDLSTYIRRRHVEVREDFEDANYPSLSVKAWRAAERSSIECLQLERTRDGIEARLKAARIEASQ